jgi:transcriptional regulator with XRE-family HTH domain
LGIGQRIRAERELRGLTQEALARRADLSLNVVHKIERGGIRDPHLATVVSLADALGITVSALLEEAGKALARSVEPGEPELDEEAREALHELSYIRGLIDHALAAPTSERIMDVRETVREFLCGGEHEPR